MMEFVSTVEFGKSLLENKDANLPLIVDVRPYISYNEEHISGSYNLYCPPILKRRFANGGTLHLESLLNNETKNKLMTGKYSQIVIYGSKETWEDTNCDLHIVWHCLCQLGVKEKCRILQGGYDDFRQQFPFLCTKQDQTRKFSSEKETASAKSQRHALYRTNSTQIEPVELLPHLYIGNADTAASLYELRRQGITAVLNVSSTCQNYFKAEFQYKNIPVADNHSTELSGWFTEAIQFIDDVKRANGKTLVHCQAGVSRSATICIAYIMHSKNLSVDKAFDFVRSRRTEISPNASFMQQLMEFEKEIRIRMPEEDVSSQSSSVSTPLSSLSPPLSPCRFYSLSSPCSVFSPVEMTSPFSTPFSSPSRICSPMVAFT